MSMNDYDKILNLIEDNVERKWSTIELILRNELFDSIRNISDFRRRIADDDLTIIQYFKERKMLRLLDEATRLKDSGDVNATLEMLSQKYGYDEYTTFYRTVIMKFNEAPARIVEKGHFVCPEPRYLEQIVEDGDRKIVSSKELSVDRNNINKLKEVNREQIDQILGLQEENSQLKKELRELNRKKANGEPISVDMFDKKNSAAPFAWVGGARMYKIFQNMESLRCLYRLTNQDIVNLYNQSLNDEISLSELCERYAFMKEYELYKAEQERWEMEEYNDALIAAWEEEMEEFVEEEGSLAEVWSEYYADGESDAYEGYGERGENDDYYYYNF